MSSLQLSVPSKTFLLGEYVALTGGPAILLATTPRFELLVTTAGESNKVHHIGIHRDSPAGKLIANNPIFYQQYDLNFSDPYQGLGGLGASSAQFAMVYALQQLQQPFPDEEIFNALTVYQQVAWSGQGSAPSGADVTVQLKGSLCFFHKASRQITAYTWPFSDMEFCLLHTGRKVATHEHLKEINLSNCSDLEEIVLAGLSGLKNKDSEMFVHAIKQYAEALQARGWLAEHTLSLLEQISLQKGVLATKGCGALGADIIFVMLTKASRQGFMNWATTRDLRIISVGNTVSHGLECFFEKYI